VAPPFWRKSVDIAVKIWRYVVGIVEQPFKGKLGKIVKRNAGDDSQPGLYNGFGFSLELGEFIQDFLLCRR
jgi:hypothetical protein